MIVPDKTRLTGSLRLFYQDRNMRHCVVRLATALVGIASLTVASAYCADARPARPGFATPSPSAAQAKELAQTGRLPAAPQIVIRGRIGKSIPITPGRAGVTYSSSTKPFPTTAMPRQIDRSLPHTRKFGDGTVVTGSKRTGVTHAGKTFPFGAEIGTRHTGLTNSGLTTRHTPGRVWAGFRRAQ